MEKDLEPGADPDTRPVHRRHHGHHHHRGQWGKGLSKITTTGIISRDRRQAWGTRPNAIRAFLEKKQGGSHEKPSSHDHRPGGSDTNVIISTKNIVSDGSKIVIALCFFATTVYGFNPDDLERVKKTNRCEGCDLSGADFSKFALNDAELSGAKMASVKMSGADLFDANLSGAGSVRRRPVSD